jgi:DNA gyrase subunit A
VRVRARAHVEPLPQGKEAIIVTELPFMVKKGGDGGFIKKIADLHADKKLPEITNVEDHSDRNGMRVVIELKRDANPKVVLNKLYKHTQMQATFGVNMVALVDNVPKTLSLKSVLAGYVQHQREVIVRRSKHELRALEARAHRLEGLLIALDHLDEVIELIRGSRDRDVARSGLMERYGLTHIQAQAILELRLQQLTALEADALRREHTDVVERIRELRELLGDEEKVLELIKEELTEIAERYGDERRTVISPAEDDLDIEDLIADQQMVIAISKSGYIKSLPLATYRQQRRGGVGITGMDLKEDDYIEHLFVCSTHDYLLFFTNRGKIYRSKVYDLPEAGRTSKGRYLGNVLPLREGERVQSVLATRDFAEAPYLVFGTRNGVVKKTAFGAYNTPIKADGIIAINIRDEDELVAVRRVDEGDEILMVSHAGLAVRFGEDDARAMGRDTSGVRGMDVRGKDNYVLAMDVARPGQDLLVVTENGFGKRTAIDEYRLTSRGAKGVKTINFTEAKGLLAAALVVREHQDLVFISQNGMVQRTGVRGINRYGRASQGVRVMNLREGDEVSAVALVVETDAPTAASSVAGDPISLDASGTADEDALTGELAEDADVPEDEGVIAADPTDDSLLTPPEVEEDDLEP